jgi:chitinase
VNTSAYTHLYWAFATIDPSTFKVVPANPRDVDYYPAFTNLEKTSTHGLKTWISMTGFDFSDANTSTHTTWSDMVSSSTNRQAFISGAIAFMTKYGFSGIDLDWEYPVDHARGGRPGDMANLVRLLADMRARSDFGRKFGISVTLAPDIWYLQHYDAKGLLANADFLGFMSYVCQLWARKSRLETK